MNNDDFFLLEENSEHANLPKVSINSPNLFFKNTSFLFNKINNNKKHNTVKEKDNLINKINLTKKIKIILKNEDNINKKNENFIKIPKKKISTINRDNLQNSQNLENNGKLKNKKIKNSPKVGKKLRNSIELGNSFLFKKKNLLNSNLNSDINRALKNNIDPLAKKIMKKKELKENKSEIKSKENSINKKCFYKKILNNRINPKELGIKESTEENFNINKRLINKSRDFNTIKKENNTFLTIKEKKNYIDKDNKEVSKKDKRKIIERNQTHINTIKFFNSNSSQILFNKENNNNKLKNDNNNDKNNDTNNDNNNANNKNKKTYKEKVNLKIEGIASNFTNGTESKKDYIFKTNILNDIYKSGLDSDFNNDLLKKKNLITNYKCNSSKMNKKKKFLLKSVHFKSNEKTEKDNIKYSKFKNSNSENNIILKEEKDSKNKEEIKSEKKENNDNVIEEFKNKNETKEKPVKRSLRLTLPIIEIKKIQKKGENNEEEEELTSERKIDNSDNKNKESEQGKEKEKKKKIKLRLNINNLINKVGKESHSCPKKEKKNNINNEKKNNLQKELNKEENIIINNFKSHYSLSKAGKDELGNSKTNQDTYVVLTSINGIKEFNIFGVLDGHGAEGHLISQYVAKYIELEFHNHPKLEKIKNIEKMYEQLKSNDYQIIKEIYKGADKALSKEEINSNNSGTTCVLVLQIGIHIICSNVGDSRAILVFDEENDQNLNSIQSFPLSFDTKPEIPEEKERILNMGGVVRKIINKYGQEAGPYRVWAKNKDYPGLAMSRSLGDFSGKRIGVISEPEFIECILSIYSKFIVICSDGVWEFLNNEDVMNLGKKFYLQNNPRGFCKELIEKSIRYWRREDNVIDDITVVAIFY